MEKSLQQTPLFHGCSQTEVGSLIHCLQIERQTVKKGTTILQMGDFAHGVGIILTGSVTVEHYDTWGNRSILDVLHQGELFAEMYALVPTEQLMVSIIAAETSEIAFCQVSPLFDRCSRGCGAERKVLQNLLTIAAKKNLMLSQKIFHTSAKSIRQRLLSYLSAQAVRTGSHDLIIPYNRQQLADYLNVERSALSYELSKMQKDGLITFKKNHFHLHVHEVE